MLGGAHALLHLIDFDEPFGYSVVEAMACGTPGHRPRTAARWPSSSTDATTGYLVDDLDGAVRAVDAAGALDRQTIRDRTIRQFDRATMVDQYVAVYRSVLAGRTSTR